MNAQIDIGEDAAYGDSETSRVSQNYVKQALGALMPVVLETLSKQDEENADDLEHWDLGACCSAVASASWCLLQPQMLNCTRQSSSVTRSCR